MEVGIMLYARCKTDIYEQIRILKEIGVRHTFINAGHPELDNVLTFMKKEGVICDNLHSEYNGSFRGEACTMYDISHEGSAGDKMKELIMKNIEKCAEYNIPVLVVHPPTDLPEKSMTEFAKERYIAIGDYAREKDVTIALENISYTKNLEYAMSLIPDAKFCWDCGHENCRLKGEKPMPLFGKKLAALHIHDNFLEQDHHMIPFTGKVNFDDVGKQLAESGFDGTIMLEILYGSNEWNSTESTYKDFAIKAKCAAEKLISIIEEYKGKFVYER